MRISLCMIVRDEAGDLGRCLESVQGTVDEICVLDTGSRDRTIAVAERYGARLGHFAWDNDFAAARNASLRLATGDWILVLDADEVLVQEDTRARLDAFMARYPGRAGHVTIRDQMSGPAGGPVGGPAISPAGGPAVWPAQASEVLTAVTRFLPVAMHPSFAGRIHEQVVFGPGRTPPRAHTTVDVQHFGYAPEVMQRKGKHRRNIELLRRELADRPECPFLWYQLGLSHGLAGEPELAVQCLTRALQHADTTESYLAHLAESLAYGLRRLGEYQAALGLIEAQLASDPERPDTVFLHALLSMDLGQLAIAEAGFHRCLALHGRQPAGGAFTPSATTTAPAYNLGVLHEVTGEADTALHYYQMALAFDPRHGESRGGLARLQRAAPAR